MIVVDLCIHLDGMLSSHPLFLNVMLSLAKIYVYCNFSNHLDIDLEEREREIYIVHTSHIVEKIYLC